MIKTLKEWPVEVWLVLRDGKPFDYAFSRSDAFKKAAAGRNTPPAHAHFWSVTPAKATLSVKVGK